MSDKGNLFVYLDFQRKIVYSTDKLDWHEPATEKERKAFITHFYNKGINQCTFQEFKQYVVFNGVKKRGRIYATVLLTDKFVYQQLLQMSDNMQDAIGHYIEISKEKEAKHDKISGKQFIKAIINAIDKLVDEV